MKMFLYGMTGIATAILIMTVLFFLVQLADELAFALFDWIWY